MKLSITSYGSMPNQVYGSIGEDSFEFRARHGGWTLWVNGEVIMIGEGEKTSGGEPGWWHPRHAKKFVIERLLEYYATIAQGNAIREINETIR